jgi:hypothetical protein
MSFLEDCEIEKPYHSTGTSEKEFASYRGYHQIGSELPV